MLDAVLGEAKGFLGEDPVVQRAEDVISPEAVAAGGVIRAVDVLLVVTMLLDRVGRPSPASLSIPKENFGRSW